MVTVKREAELLFLNSSSNFNPPRCTEKSNGLPAMYLSGVCLSMLENLFNNNGGGQLPSEIGRRHLMFSDNAVQVEGVPWLVGHHSRSQN